LEKKQSGHWDVVIVGAGIAGLYMLHRCRELGLLAHIYEKASDIGGTWYWNRYPGARCDIESMQYSYSWDQELQIEWEWSERFAAQPEILSYLNHVADRYDFRRDISFDRIVSRAIFDDRRDCWGITLTSGEQINCNYLILATGCLSEARLPDIPGRDSFSGEVYHTGSWPHDGVDFSGKRVGVIGTGSSGIQVIPEIAKVAEHLTVFQRTANFAIPARNAPLPSEYVDEWKSNYSFRRKYAREETVSGTIYDLPKSSALDVSIEAREAIYQARWKTGGANFMHSFNDLVLNEDANLTAADFVRARIRAKVNDPAVATLLCPDDHLIFTKRICIDDHYFETYNSEHVDLVSLRLTPIEAIESTGIRTSDQLRELDAIVFATGFDALTGAITAMDIRGISDLAIKDKWAEGPRAYLGLATAGFPNLFMITGPGSPSVLSNVMVSIEQHVEYISELLGHMQAHGLSRAEADKRAEDGWMIHVGEVASRTLLPRTASWYMGANIPGKPRVFMPYIGVAAYRKICNEVAVDGYRGLALSKKKILLHPVVVELLQKLEGRPPISDGTPDQARKIMAAARQIYGKGPIMKEVQEVDVPTRSGKISARLLIPSGNIVGVVVYLHGGGWVMGSIEDFDAVGRNLAVASSCAVLIPEYRLAPEVPFPGALQDCEDALFWAADNVAPVFGTHVPVVIAGDSAGGNLAAVLASRFRGKVPLAMQVLIYPVVDCDFKRPSYRLYGDNLLLKATDMAWFFEHYAESDQWYNRDVSPIRSNSLEGLPPAVVVLAEYDVLLDEGIAYANALKAAGVPVTRRIIEGMTHGFIRMHNLCEPARDAIFRIGADIRAACIVQKNGE
jgi:cation diffusion facilitator CzcD-associated flavoprotein CzcO/acetyl esterase/lipase